MGLLDYSVNDKKYFNSGREYEQERIIKLLQDRLDVAKNTQGIITAMQVPVELEVVEAITEALIYAIKGEQNDQVD